MQPLYTIGHSTHPIEEFIAILQAHGIQHLADVRGIPRSRHVPWFNEDQLPATLRQAGIGYSHHALLGGRRHTQKDSPNQGWKNASFRGYADYMATPEFARGLRELDRLIQKKRVAIMCAEAVPWRCHRNLIADAQVAQGRQVYHIFNATTAKPHTMIGFGMAEHTRHGIVMHYPAQKPSETSKIQEATLWD